MKRKLGKSGIDVSAVGMGCWAIGGPWTIHGSQAGWGKVDDEESIRAIHAALDRGIDFFDTAANYGCGHSEKVLGQALAGRRDQVVIATKFGYLVDEETREVSFYDGDINSDKVAANVRQDCEASLRRLESDYIDLFLFHINKYPPDRAAAVRDALEGLVAEGKVRFFGWSTDNPEGARVFAASDRCVAVEHRLNAIADAPEMLALCDEFDLASIARGPLARGALTGKYTADSEFAPDDLRHGDEFHRRWLVPILDQLKAIGDELASDGRTLPQGALAWIWARSQIAIPIPGIRSVAQAEENAAAMQFGPLGNEQMAKIEQLLGR